MDAYQEQELAKRKAEDLKTYTENPDFRRIFGGFDAFHGYFEARRSGVVDENPQVAAIIKNKVRRENESAARKAAGIDG